MNHPEPWKRKAAIEALGQARDPASLDGLFAAVSDGHEPVRAAAFSAMGRIPTPRCVELLSRVMAENRDPSMRRLAVESLGALGIPQAEVQLVDALKDPDHTVRQNARHCLLNSPHYRPRSEKSVERLLDLLKEKEVEVRRSAINCLRYCSHPPVIKALLGLAKDPNAQIRSCAIAALGGAAGMRPLLAALKEENSRVRVEAVKVLGTIREKWSVESLADALAADKDRFVRYTAATALGTHKGPRVVECLVRALDDKDSFVCKAAAEALGRTRDKRAVEPLIRRMGQTDNVVVLMAAATALGELRDARGAAPLARLLAAGHEYEDGGIGFGEMLRSRVASALTQIRDPSTVDLLLPESKNAKAPVRRSVIEVLGSFKDPRIVPHLVKSLRDEDKSVRSAAARALLAFHSDERVKKELKKYRERERAAHQVHHGEF